MWDSKGIWEEKQGIATELGKSENGRFFQGFSWKVTPHPPNGARKAATNSSLMGEQWLTNCEHDV